MGSAVFRPPSLVPYRTHKRRRYTPTITAAAITPTVPTECWLADDVVYDRDLTVVLHITIHAGMGYRIERRSGAGQTQPAGPGLGGSWALVEQFASSDGGSMTLQLGGWPANDADYTVSVWEYNGATYSATAATATVFAIDSPDIGLAGDDFVSMRIRTARAGYPRIQLSPDPAFGLVTADYNPAEDGVVGWRLIPEGSGTDVGDPTIGAPLSANGWPAGSQNLWCRREIPVQPGTRYIRAAHACGTT